MTKQIDTKALALAIKSTDKAAGTALSAARKVAEILVADHDPAQPYLAERERMIKVAKEAAVDNKVKLTHEKNVWRFIREQLTVQMYPDQLVEVKPATEKHGAVMKSAEDCKTARDISKAVKQIKEVHNATDGRVNNGPAKQDTNAKLAHKVAELIKEDSTFLAALRKELRAVNYTVRLARSKVQAKRKGTKKTANNG